MSFHGNSFVILIIIILMRIMSVTCVCKTPDSITDNVIHSMHASFFLMIQGRVHAFGKLFSSH